MPMMYYPEYFPPPPPPPRKPTAAVLSSQLLDAIHQQDHDAARKIFDTAFWEKIALQPDGFHLLQAATRGDRQMVALLTSYGATWTPDETKLARSMVADANWAHIEGPLRNAGLRTQYAPAERRDVNLETAIRWAHRAAMEGKARGAQDAESSLRELNAMLSTTLVHFVMTGDLERAKNVLLYRDPKLGDGRQGNPLDVSAEFRLIQKRHPLSRRQGGLAFLDALAQGGLAIKPLRVTSLDLLFSTQLVPELERRGLLAGAEPDARREILSALTRLEQVINFGDRVHDLGAGYISLRRAELVQAARIVFGKEPPNESDAESFIYLRRHAAARTPAALAIAENELLAMGFFDATVWTVDRLRRLSSAADPEFSLTKAFNTKAAYQELSDTALPKLLHPKKFKLVLEALGPFGWKPNADDTVKILDYLHGETPRGMTEEAEAALKALREARADFSRVDPNRYLGKRDPGLARALLDAGVVKPAHFDLEKIYGRTGDFTLMTGPSDKRHPYAEFLCQVILELVDPERYIPHRYAPVRNYQKLFIAEWVVNIEPRISKTPPPPRGTSSTGPR